MRNKKAKIDDGHGNSDLNNHTNWTQLPTELWMNIAHHLPIKSILNLSCTCKTLHDLCRDPCLWTRVSIDWQSIKKKTQITENLLVRCTKLSHLTITNRTFEQVNSPLIINVIKKAKDSVTNLILSPEIALANAAVMKLSEFSNLTSLELAGDWIKTTGAVEWTEYFGVM